MPVVIPDFNEPAFEHLTITRMLDQVREALAALPRGPDRAVRLEPRSIRGRAVLRGGDGLGLGSARAHRSIDPACIYAFDFGRIPFANLGDALARWKESGRLDVFHHAFGRRCR